MKNIFFNSSMPRSGSTLLQNIFNQNPEIHATPTDGSLELLFGSRINFTESNEFKAQDPELMKNAFKGFCWGGLQGYSNGLTERPNVCIKSRGIGIHYKWYSEFFQGPVKIVCCVRDLRSIFSSMEKIFRNNQIYHQPIQNHSQMSGTTTYKRILSWVNSPPIGLALERFHQMIHEGIINNCHIVKYEELTTNPDIEMKKIYNYLELPYYQHNWNFIEQTTKEDDNVYGMNLHTINNELKTFVYDWDSVLGVDNSEWINKNINWYQKYFRYL